MPGEASTPTTSHVLKVTADISDAKKQLAALKAEIAGVKRDVETALVSFQAQGKSRTRSMGLGKKEYDTMLSALVEMTRAQTEIAKGHEAVLTKLAEENARRKAVLKTVVDRGRAERAMALQRKKDEAEAAKLTAQRIAAEEKARRELVLTEERRRRELDKTQAQVAMSEARVRVEVAKSEEVVRRSEERKAHDSFIAEETRRRENDKTQSQLTRNEALVRETVARSQEKQRQEIEKTATLIDARANIAKKDQLDIERKAIQVERERLRLQSAQEKQAAQREVASRRRTTGVQGFLSGLSEGSFAQKLGKVTSFLTAAGIYFTVSNAFRSLIGSVSEFEKKMIDIRKVMNDANADFDAMGKSVLSLAVKYGTAVGEVADAAITFARQGKSQHDTLRLTEAALLAQNIAEIEAADAAKYLTATIAQYNLTADDALDVLDAWNNVSNRNAVTVQDLAEAMSRTASVANALGIGFHELNGIVATLTEATGKSGEEIGNALKTALARVVSDDSITAFEQAGIAVRTTAGDYRDFSEILGEVGRNWNSYSEATRNALTTALGEKRHANVFRVLFERYDQVLKKTTDSVKSSGSAMRENEKYMRSYSKQVQALKSAVYELAVAIGSSGLLWALKAAVDVAKGAVGVFNALPDPIKKATVATGGLTAALVALNIALKAFGVSTGLASLKVVASAFTTVGMAKGLPAGTIVGVKGLGTALLGLGKAAAPFLIFAGKIAIVLGLVYGAVLLLVKGYKYLKEQLQGHADFNKGLYDSATENLDRINSEIESVTRLAEDYKRLSAIKARSAEQESERQKALTGIAKILPNVVQYEKDTGKAIGLNSRLLDEQISRLKTRQAELEKLTKEQKELRLEQLRHELDLLTSRRSLLIERGPREDLIGAAWSGLRSIFSGKTAEDIRWDDYFEALSSLNDRISNIHQEIETLASAGKRAMDELGSKEVQGIPFIDEGAVQKALVFAKTVLSHLDQADLAVEKLNGALKEAELIYRNAGASSAYLTRQYEIQADKLEVLKDLVSRSGDYLATLEAYRKKVEQTYDSRIAAATEENLDELEEQKEKDLAKIDEAINRIADSQQGWKDESLETLYAIEDIKIALASLPYEKIAANVEKLTGAFGGLAAVIELYRAGNVSARYQIEIHARSIAALTAQIEEQERELATAMGVREDAARRLEEVKARTREPLEDSPDRDIQTLLAIQSRADEEIRRLEQEIPEARTRLVELRNALKEVAEASFDAFARGRVTLRQYVDDMAELHTADTEIVLDYAEMRSALASMWEKGKQNAYDYIQVVEKDLSETFLIAASNLAKILEDRSVILDLADTFAGLRSVGSFDNYFANLAVAAQDFGRMDDAIAGVVQTARLYWDLTGRGLRLYIEKLTEAERKEDEVARKRLEAASSQLHYYASIGSWLEYYNTAEAFLEVEKSHAEELSQSRELLAGLWDAGLVNLEEYQKRLTELKETDAIHTLRSQVRQLNEDLAEGTKSALSDAISGVLNGEKGAFTNLADSLRKMYNNLFARQLAESLMNSPFVKRQVEWMQRGFAELFGVTDKTFRGELLPYEEFSSHTPPEDRKRLTPEELLPPLDPIVQELKNIRKAVEDLKPVIEGSKPLEAKPSPVPTRETGPTAGSTSGGGTGIGGDRHYPVISELHLGPLGSRGSAPTYEEVYAEDYARKFVEDWAKRLAELLDTRVAAAGAEIEGLGTRVQELQKKLDEAKSRIPDKEPEVPPATTSSGGMPVIPPEETRERASEGMRFTPQEKPTADLPRRQLTLADTMERLIGGVKTLRESLEHFPIHQPEKGEGIRWQLSRLSLGMTSVEPVAREEKAEAPVHTSAVSEAMDAINKAGSDLRSFAAVTAGLTAAFLLAKDRIIGSGGAAPMAQALGNAMAGFAVVIGTGQGEAQGGRGLSTKFDSTRERLERLGAYIDTLHLKGINPLYDKASSTTTALDRFKDVLGDLSAGLWSATKMIGQLFSLDFKGAWETYRSVFPSEENVKKPIENSSVKHPEGTPLSDLPEGQSVFQQWWSNLQKWWSKAQEPGQKLQNMVPSPMDDPAFRQAVISGIVDAARLFLESWLLGLPIPGGIGSHALGGYTGGYDPRRVVGVVHGGEYVIPAWMVRKYRDLISSLEATRMRGYASGGYVESASPAVVSGVTQAFGTMLEYLRKIASYLSPERIRDILSAFSSTFMQTGSVGAGAARAIAGALEGSPIQKKVDDFLKQEGLRFGFATGAMGLSQIIGGMNQSANGQAGWSNILSGIGTFFGPVWSVVGNLAGSLMDTFMPKIEKAAQAVAMPWTKTIYEPEFFPEPERFYFSGRYSRYMEMRKASGVTVTFNERSIVVNGAGDPDAVARRIASAVGREITRNFKRNGTRGLVEVY